MASRNKITVASIAKKAGVSPATVSRVINNRYDLVKPDTVKQVQAAIQDLGYSAPEFKSAPPQEETVLIMNLPNINNFFYSKVIEGANTSAISHGCHLIIYQAPLDMGYAQGFLNLIKRVNAAGAILVGPVSASILEQINRVIPLVQCCEFNYEVDLPYVSVDDCKAAYGATEYLIEHGYYKIAFINGPSNYKYSKERQKGFLQAIENANLTIPKSWVIRLPEVNYEMAYATVCQLLSAETKPNAFFTVADTYAAAVIRAAKRFHYKIPEDIAVIGFDNTEVSTICTPSITTVSQPRFQMGFTACEVLLERINTPGIEPRSLLLDTELIIREST